MPSYNGWETPPTRNQNVIHSFGMAQVHFDSNRLPILILLLFYHLKMHKRVWKLTFSVSALRHLLSQRANAQTTVFLTLYRGQSTISCQLIKPNYLVTQDINNLGRWKFPYKKHWTRQGKLLYMFVAILNLRGRGNISII